MNRIHQVSCSIMHPDAGPGDPEYDRVSALSSRLAAYARKLGFAVTYDDVDRMD